MKKKNREITVFSISALDLFCSAMGVFMILCFVLFPYYQKKEPVPPVPTKPEPPKPEPPKPEPPKPEPPKIIPSLTIACYGELQLKETSSGQTDWCGATVYDIDLYVRATLKDGKTVDYSWRRRTHPGSTAMLMADSMRGGTEAWTHPTVTPGNYHISYTLSSSQITKYISLSNKFGGGVTRYEVLAMRVVTNVITPGGLIGGSAETDNALPPLTIPFDNIHVDPDKRIPLATVTVAEDGTITVTPAK